jgi:hypothetical protein
MADVGAGDGGGLILQDFTMEPAEQLLVDMVMGGTESGVDLVGVMSIPGHIIQSYDYHLYQCHTLYPWINK